MGTIVACDSEQAFDAKIVAENEFRKVPLVIPQEVVSKVCDMLAGAG